MVLDDSYCQVTRAVPDYRVATHYDIGRRIHLVPALLVATYLVKRWELMGSGWAHIFLGRDASEWFIMRWLSSGSRTLATGHCSGPRSARF